MALATRQALKRAAPSAPNKPLPDKKERRNDRTHLDVRRRNGDERKERILTFKEWTGWLLLAPVCLFSLVTFADLLLRAARDGGFWGSVELKWFMVGTVCWLLPWLMMPRWLMIVYVFAHEWTHLLTAKAFGAVVYDWHVGHDGGWVDTSKSNTAISLSPYLVPLYTTAVVLLFGLLGLFLKLDALYHIPLGSVQLPFHGQKVLCYLIGFTWCLHFSCTVHTLRVEQSDLKRNGSFFSGWLIVLCNLMIVAALLIIASPTITWFDAWHSLEKAVVWTFGSAFQVVATTVLSVWGAFAEIFRDMRDWKVQ